VSKNRVLVLHPGDELKLIEFQSKLQKKIENRGVKVLRTFPLFAFFENEISCEDEKQIESVTLGSPEKEGSYFYFPVSVSIGNNVIQGKINFLFVCGKTETEPLDSEFTEIKCRIFRFASFHQDENSYWLTDSRWKKLGKTNK